MRVDDVLPDDFDLHVLSIVYCHKNLRDLIDSVTEKDKLELQESANDISKRIEIKRLVLKRPTKLTWGYMGGYTGREPNLKTTILGSMKKTILFALVVVAVIISLSLQPVIAQTPPVAAEDLIAIYTVEITPALASQNEVKVTASFKPAGVAELTVSSYLSPGFTEQRIFIDGSYDRQNQPVKIEQVDSNTWKVDTASALTLEYRARVDIASLMSPGTYLAYLSEECGLISASSILLAPRAGGGNVAVSFVLPEGWTVITDETWIPDGHENSR